LRSADTVRSAVHDPEAGIDQGAGSALRRADCDQSKPAPGATAMRKKRPFRDGPGERVKSNLEQTFLVVPCGFGMRFRRKNAEF
jgi:hypothetical protein